MKNPKFSAIVTGGSKGIGRAISLELAKDQDLIVVINYNSNPKMADEVVREIKSLGGKAVAVKADVSKEEEVKFLFDSALKQAPIKILVNNAGVVLYKSIAETTLLEFQKVFDINVTGTFLTSREASRTMEENGRIINITSTVTGLMFPTYGTYAASKGAVEQITRVLAKELGKKKITVNAIAPGPVATELFFEGKSDQDVQRLAQMAALGRIGEPTDIANAVQLLVTAQSSWITGQVIRVNGGLA